MSALLQLPSELWRTIEDFLDDGDCRRLCQTCHGLLELLGERSYRHVLMDEGYKSGGSILALAQGPRAQFVRTVLYLPSDPKPVLGWGEMEIKDEHDGSIELSDESREVLESLYLFENLDKFRFVLDWDLENWPGTPFYISKYAFDMYHHAYDEEPWRILLEESLSALAISAGTFTKLEVQNLPPIPTDTPYLAMETDEWKAMLEGLTAFDITLGSIKDRGSGSMTTIQQEFLERFPELFLNHLPNIEYLRIAGTEWGVIGHYEDRVPIDWGVVELPRLQVFELEYSCFNHVLVDFIFRHSSTLEKIYFRHCFAAAMDDWGNLFAGIAEGRSKRLVDLRIIAYPALKRNTFPNHEAYRDASHAMWDKIDRAAKLLQWDDWDICLTCGHKHLDPNGEAITKVEGNDDNKKYGRKSTRYYSNEPRTWEEMEVFENRWRFVVANTCGKYGQIQVNNEPENDESSVVESWGRVEEVLRENRARRGLSIQPMSEPVIHERH